MKKILAIMLAVIVAVGMFAGCSSNPDTTNGSTPSGSTPSGSTPSVSFEGQKVTMWVASNFDLNEDMFYFKKMEEAIGCDIEFTFFPAGEMYTAQISNALATNSLPDICALSNVTVAEMANYGDRGAFVNFLDPDVLAKMPNFKKIMIDDPEAYQLYVQGYASQTTGNAYTLPIWDLNRKVNHGWMYREDVFTELGIELWGDGTPEENNQKFLDALRALKKAYPDSYPLTGYSMNEVWNRVINSFGHNHTTGAYDWEDEEWYMSVTEEGYYDMIEVFRIAWSEGLVDPDIFSNTTENVDANVTKAADEKGASFVYNAWIGRMAVQNKAGQAKDPDFHVSFAPNIGDGKFLTQSKISNSGTVISAQAENLDACLAIADWWYSEEGMIAGSIGEEGVTFDMVDGVRVYKNADGTPMENVSGTKLEEEFGMWNSHMYKRAAKDSCYYVFTAEEQLAQDMGDKYGYTPGLASLRLDPSLATIHYEKANALFEDSRDFIADFITKNGTRADWEAFAAECKNKYQVALFDSVYNLE